VADTTDPQEPQPEFDETKLPSSSDSNIGGPLDDLGLGGPLENLDFSEPADLGFSTEAVAGEGLDAVAGEPAAAEAAAGGAAPIEGQESAEAAPGEEEVEEGVLMTEKAPPKWLAFVDWAVLGLVLTGVVLFVWKATAHPIWNGGYLVLLAAIAFTLWKTRSRWSEPQISAVYTVMLAVSTAALLTSVYCLGLEIASYNWDFWGTKAKKARQAIQFVPPSTTAAACPAAIQVTASAGLAGHESAAPWMTSIGQSGSGRS
jgi:hypothetical protein